jgi:hypothetical protein
MLCAGVKSAATEHIIVQLESLVQSSPSLFQLHEQLKLLAAQAEAALIELPEQSIIPVTKPTPIASLVMANSDFSSLKLEELRALAKARGLSHKGLKRDIVARLCGENVEAERTSPDITTISANDSRIGIACVKSETAVIKKPTGFALDLRESPVGSSLKSMLERVARDNAGKGPQNGIFTDGACVSANVIALFLLQL